MLSRNLPPWAPLAATAAASSAATALTLWFVRRRHQKKFRKRLLDEMGSDGDDEPTQVKPKQISPVIIEEALARHRAFFGTDGLNKIRDAFVVVIGLGGVGSAAASFLVRGGVRKIRIVDFDQVTLSSMNRHACATLDDVGTPKTTCCAQYFHAIAPWVDIESENTLFTLAQADALLRGNPDYVLDCIDNIDTKADLLKFCADHGIKVISSSGAASKADPSRIQIADISTTYEDPLARSVRRILKARGVVEGIPVVYSTEKPKQELKLLPLPQDEYEKGRVDELSALQNFRVRILPVLGPIPAMFGNAMASYVLCVLGNVPVEPLPVQNRTKAASTIFKLLSTFENKASGALRIPFNEQDVQYIYEEVFNMRSVLPPHGYPQIPALIRWRRELPLTWDNLALMEKSEAKMHLEKCLLGNESPENLWGHDAAAAVKKRVADEAQFRSRGT